MLKKIGCIFYIYHVYLLHFLPCHLLRLSKMMSKKKVQLTQPKKKTGKKETNFSLPDFPIPLSIAGCFFVLKWGVQLSKKKEGFFWTI